MFKKVEAEASSGSMAPEMTAKGKTLGNSLKDLDGSLNLCPVRMWTGQRQLNRVGKHSALTTPLQEQGLGPSAMEVSPLVILLVLFCFALGLCKINLTN